MRLITLSIFKLPVSYAKLYYTVPPKKFYKVGKFVDALSSYHASLRKYNFKAILNTAGFLARNITHDSLGHLNIFILFIFFGKNLHLRL